VALLPAGQPLADRAKLDVAGAIAVTASLMLAVYAIVHGNEAGWALTFHRELADEIVRRGTTDRMLARHAAQVS